MYYFLVNLWEYLSAKEFNISFSSAVYNTDHHKLTVHAKIFHLLNFQAAYRFKAQRICVYIDERNLPEDGELKLSLVEGNARAVLPRAQLQYRLKPAYGYELPCQV